MSFVETHGLLTPQRLDAALKVERMIQEHGLETIRVSFADQHGLLRGKTVMAADVSKVLLGGVSITSSLLAKDTANRTVFPVWSAGGGFGERTFEGAGDLLMVPDPATFRILPWAHRQGWLLADLYYGDGRPVPLSSRQVLRSALDRLGAAGYDMLAGLEVEFHLFRLETKGLRPEDAGQPGAPPEASILTAGYQYLSELRFDQIEPALEPIRDGLIRMGLPLRSVECEYGPSQAEMTFQVMPALDAADTMVLFRSAVKQIARRNGLHATFMCRPRIPNVMSSGWHLHQSLKSRKSGLNAFRPERVGDVLSPVGRDWLGGLVRHARAATVFTTPTINGYKRFRTHSLAPDRAVWGQDNRGVMLRVLSAANDPASRIENRVGEPAANPYLYIASQVVAGLDGLSQHHDPGPSADTPYETTAEPLPKSLAEAIIALRQDTFFREALGPQLVDYILTIKEAEVARFLSEVTDWEHREYFEMY